MQPELFNTTAERHFLGWESPLIPSAVSWLQRYNNANALDLTHVSIVVPTLHGVRQLEKRLDRSPMRAAKDVQMGWIGTVGSLPEQLYSLRDVLGESTNRSVDLEHDLFWADVLRQTPEPELRKVISNVPQQSETAAWMGLARTIGRLHAELAAAGVSFAEIAADTASEGRPMAVAIAASNL